MIQLLHREMQISDARHDRTSMARWMDQTSPMREPTFTVWGLSPRELHDAYWRSKGIQCIRRGEIIPVQKAAELYLLIEPSQLVLFDVGQISDRLTWRDAVLTRVRLVHECSERYSEHVVLDDQGHVQRIARKYRPAMVCSTRVIITSSRRVASLWMNAIERRQGLRKIRRAVAWTKIDHWRGTGSVFFEGNDQLERRLLDELVERWPFPDSSIDGLEEVEPGVWHVRGDLVVPNVVRVGPLWLGRGACHSKEKCVLGPAWMADQATEDVLQVQIRDIDDVEPPAPRGDQVSPPPLAPQPKILSPSAIAVKRAFDIVGSLTALLMTLPIMCAIAVLILLEDGRPLFFGHTRQGKGGRVFRCWKFRTMQRNAEQMARELQRHNVCDGPQVFIENDPRVTKVGRILRATNLDELPQFWNVLIGQMSIVGPRPSPDRENQYCPAWRDLRLSVRPGITGLWQLNRTRRRGADFQEWIKYDIQYVQKSNLWLDLVIMIRTALMLIGWRKPRAVAAKK